MEVERALLRAKTLLIDRRRVFHEAIAMTGKKVKIVYLSYRHVPSSER